MAIEAAKITIKVATEGASQATKEVDNLDTSMGSLNATLGKFAIAAAEFAIIKQVIDFLGNATKAFGEAETSALRLDNALKMRNMQSSSEATKRLSAEMQKLIGVDGDFVNQLQAELVMQGKSEAQIKKMIKAAADLSAVTGDSLDVSLQKLNNTLSGSARELARTNPEIKNMTEEQLKAGAAVDFIATRYEGMAEAMQGSLEVQQKVTEQARGDAMEALGEALAPAILSVNQAITGIIQVGTALLNVFNSMPGPIKFIVGGLTALVAVMTAYTLLKKSTIVQTGIEIAQQIILTAKQGLMTAVTWLRTTAQIALNTATIVGLGLTGAGIALIASAIAAGSAYAASQKQQAQAMSGTADATEALNEMLDKQIGLFSSAWDIATVKAMDQLTEKLGVTRDELKSVMAAFQGVKNTAQNVTLSIEKGWIKQEEGVTRITSAYQNALDSAINYASSLDRTTKEGAEAFASITKEIPKLQAEVAKWQKKEEELKKAEDAKKTQIEEAKKRAEEQKKIEADRQKAITDTIEKLKEEFITMRMSEEQKLRYNLENKKATQAEIDKAIALQRGIDITKDQIQADREKAQLALENSKAIEDANRSYKELLKNLEDEAAKATLSEDAYKALKAERQNQEDIDMLKSAGLTGEDFDKAFANLQKLRAEIAKGPAVIKTWADGFNEVISVLGKVGETFTYLNQIAQNVHDQELQGIDSENQKNKEAWEAKIKQAEAEGATVEEINALKAKAQNDQEKRDKDYQSLQKKYAREQAIAQKTAAFFQATVAGAAAIIKGFQEGGWPLGVATIAMVAAQQAAILATPIPEAQFGGSFQVPPGLNGDSGLVRVNSGEQVSVTPSRESGQGGGTMILSIDGREFKGFMEEQVNSALNSGRVTTTRRGVVRA